MEKKELSANTALGITFLVFIAAYFIPFKSPIVQNATLQAFMMLGEYAREHVLLCLVPAMFIAGAITVFLNQNAVIKYLGPKAGKFASYGVASVSGAILAVCSCTVLPLFKGIYKKGAGLGPAVSFLYSGPAINVLAIVMSCKVFGWQIGLARMAGAVLFAVLTGVLMQAFFSKEEESRIEDDKMFRHRKKDGDKTLFQMSLFMFSMTGILVFINWANSNGESLVWDIVYSYKYYISAGFTVLLIYSLVKWFNKLDMQIWLIATRDFALQILPYLFTGVLFAGFLLGRTGHNALIPSAWIASVAGGNSFFANLFAAVSGAFMYFATLTEVPIIQGLLGAGMGKGPALALLLAGPSLSLPSILVINAELGLKKTAVYVLLVIILSTFAGWIFGFFAR